MEIAFLDIAADPQAWRDLGFSVSEDGQTRIGEVGIRLLGTAAGKGIVGCATADGTPVDGLPITPNPKEPGSSRSVEHANGATRIDHVVVLTPDVRRTFAALAAAGAELRRERETTAPDGSAAIQGFFWAGEPILEVGGPAEPGGEAPARFWGLTLTVADLDAAAALLGERLGRVKDAVQPGRRIATVRREAGAGVPLALITPHVAASKGD